jgi:mono/diheme cytochrome c family protein
LGPDIQHPVEDYATWVVRNGRDGAMIYPSPMLAYDEATLPQDTLEGIWRFLADQPQPTTGEGLYLDYCSACHGEDGAGGPTGRPIVNEAGEISRFVRSGHELGNFAERREFMPQWSTSELSDAEVQLITQHVESL